MNHVLHSAESFNMFNVDYCDSVGKDTQVAAFGKEFYNLRLKLLNEQKCSNI